MLWQKCQKQSNVLLYIQLGTLRTKFTTPIIDYTYLNLIDLRDPDYTTNARLNVYILEEESQRYLLPRILNHKNIRNTFVVISLDLQEPWTFMEDLDRWVSVLQDLLAELKLNLQELEDMKSNSIFEMVTSFKICW
ncbi:hypothetical protein FGO68_gene11094 [Halteria grandinella]|uniref:Dynein light intermediate chain n=1 Tax=Halteria grandinella TaxID=5974 RepID=A0A8J8NAS3_HALGN|nr:hypothetical protein FGO68_gene11094 [Halteria grandinella]